MYGAFLDAGRLHVKRRHRSQASNAEFVRLVAVSPALLLFGHWILAGGERQAIDVRDFLLRRQVDDTLAGANQVVGRFAHGAESEHAGPSQPPGG